MFLYPDDIFEKLEFDKIIKLTQRYCKGEKAKVILGKPRIYTEKERVERLLTEVEELKAMIEDGNGIPLRPYYDINENLFWLRKIDYVLDVEDIHKLYHHIWSIYELDEYFQTPSIQKKYPSIFTIVQQVDFNIDLIKRYNKIFDEEGNIKASASKELGAIFKMIQSKERELNSTFNKLAGEFNKSGYLKDNKETLRNGRRVLSVNAEHKRRVDGIIHDESATGKTVFIEPQAVLQINNQLFELEAQKRKEIRKILKELCNLLRPHADDLDLWQKIVVRLDLINAKAKIALVYGGIKPKISNNKKLNLKKAYHPYLNIINAEQDKPVIPFHVELDDDKRILVISGPNAGGKSVTMKAIGLISLMLQSGMLVPVLEDSEIGLFKHMLVDIGDQQSLEDDLSTYSSRLKNMEVFLKKSKSQSLFLIDEFGSGTDPKLGGAIAEAILHELTKKGSIGIITTHYSSIKMFAFRNDSLVNGAMEFNKEKLSPTYKLKVGRPGSSFAYEIAKSVGLPQRVLNNAKKNSGEDAKEMDQLLIELQEEKRKLEKQLFENDKEKIKLQKLIKSYESAFGDLEFKRKKLKMEKKEIKLKEINQTNKELDKVIKELKEKGDLEKAKEVVVQLKTEQKEVIEVLDELKEEIYYNDDFDYKTLKVGDFVKMRTGGEAAEIIKIDKEMAILAMGFMQLNVPLRDLIPAKTPIETNARKSVVTETVNNPQTLESKLDIRGYTPQDAIDHVQEYIDNALMSNMSRLRIIHGKGTGVLRKVIAKKLKEYKDIKRVWHPEELDGGMGVTYVDF